MARILCIVGPLKGLLRSSLELSRRLAAAGHEVALASSADASADAGRRGVAFLPMAPLAQVGGSVPLPARLFGRGARRRAAAQAIAPGDLTALLDRTDPDLVLVDLELHPVVFALLRSGRRTALLDTWLSAARVDGVPPLHTELTPDDQLAVRRAWARHALWKRRRALSESLRDGGADWRSVLLERARLDGVDIDREIDLSAWLYPFAYRHLPTLVLHARELDFAHTPPANVVHVGPMLDAMEDQPHPDLVRVIGSARGRLVYGGFGSFFTADRRVLETLAEALARRPELTLVLSRGGVERTLSVPMPPNVHVADWVPQRHVLAASAVAIVHGGVNTVDECVAARVPMLVWSGGIVDMPGNTARVVHHGLGLRGDPAADGPDGTLRRLDTLMTDETVRGRLADMAAAIEAYAEAAVAERVVEALLADDFDGLRRRLGG